MRNTAMVAVVLVTMFTITAAYNGKRARAHAEAQARAEFVRDSISAERQRLADSTRIATRERIRIGQDEGRIRRQALRDSVNRVRECMRENQRRRVEKIESVVKTC